MHPDLLEAIAAGRRADLRRAASRRRLARQHRQRTSLLVILRHALEPGPRRVPVQVRRDPLRGPAL